MAGIQANTLVQENTWFQLGTFGRFRRSANSVCAGIHHKKTDKLKGYRLTRYEFLEFEQQDRTNSDWINAKKLRLFSAFSS